MSITLGNASEIPPNSRKFYTIHGEQVTILNVGGELYAIQNSCPHMGGPLGDGKVIHESLTDTIPTSRFSDFSPHGMIDRPSIEKEPVPSTISCPWHGWEFDLADGTPVFPAKRSATTYDVWVEDGLIKLDSTTEQTDEDRISDRTNAASAAGAGRPETSSA